jgi:hypothetical protein
MAIKSKSTSKADGDLEIVPDAWERFEQAVDVVIKSGPQHKTAKKAKASEADIIAKTVLSCSKDGS